MIRISSTVSLGTLLLVLIGCNGIGGPAEGSKEAAQAYLSSELDKWIADQPTKAKHFKVDLELITSGHKGGPLNYKVDAVVPDKPGLTAKTYNEPAFRINTTLYFKSAAGSTTDRPAAYNLTWHADAKKWEIESR